MNASIEQRRRALEAEVERRQARDAAALDAQRIAAPTTRLVATAVATASPEAKQRRVDELVSVMHRRVLRGPRAGTLYAGYCVYLAWCIVDEREGIVERTLHEVLTSLDEAEKGQRLDSSRAQYFVGAWKNILRERGLSPTKPKGATDVRKPK